ncbi:hypothetical protein KUV57_13520 [Epibacterium sp. DP7N7-1]|nr:hypothetical protein [Epibacterium sp. DP7N7-1]
MERDELIEQRFCHGDCYPMAIALHQALGWPIRTMAAYVAKSSAERHPAHSWVQAPDGRGFDAKGFRSEDEILEDMLATRSQFTIESTIIVTSADDTEYTSMLLHLAGGGPEFELWYRGKLDELVPEATDAITSYLEPRYAPSNYTPGLPSFKVRYQPDGITCGPSALGAVMDLLCDDAPTTQEIAELCGTNSRTGTTDVAMKRGLDALGMAYVHPDPKARNESGFLERKLEEGNVVLLRTLTSGVKHWVTAHGRVGDNYRIGCPVHGDELWSAAKVDAAWVARDRDCMVVPRDPEHHPELRTAARPEMETADLCL